jgi:hypothetical protein
MAQVDECRPIKLSVGVPQRIRVWHDGKGASPAWHLEQINLISRADGTPYYFPCGDWLNQEVNNERILHATSTDPLAKTTEYEITVVTSDIRGASTDASVTIELIGTQGRSGPRLLESPRIPDPFERGSRDVFHISCKNVGECVQPMWRAVVLQLLGCWPTLTSLLPGCVTNIQDEVLQDWARLPRQITRLAFVSHQGVGYGSWNGQVLSV